ncbi:hypothetical protein ACGF5C_27175 [Micromonospora sp. NPDC047620]|uniref:hypothetical protein n=1 Tax=Micromonospora sp. NPDC047620 TaxID=3364251 RepID=UPI003710A106
MALYVGSGVGRRAPSGTTSPIAGVINGLTEGGAEAMQVMRGPQQHFRRVGGLRRCVLSRLVAVSVRPSPPATFTVTMSSVRASGLRVTSIAPANAATGATALIWMEKPPVMQLTLHGGGRPAERVRT